jgi:hypothetical protein
LRAALRHGLDRMRTSPAWRHATTPAERLDALASVAAAAQQTITHNADLVRLMLLEPDAAPDMVDELWVRNLALAHQIMGQALRAGADDAGTEIGDPQAITGHGSSTRSPARWHGPGRFRDAWLRLNRAVFTHGLPD